MLQFTVKVPLRCRPSLLRLSGVGQCFVRDFLARGAEPVDHSFIHRFWPLSVEGIRSALALTRALDGFCGLAPLKRGIVVRIAHAHLAAARRALLQDDPRFGDLNRGLVPRITFLAEGLPFGATPEAILDAVVRAVGSPCIPLRSFRRNGILVWVLAFAQAPPVLEFTLLSAGRACEVLLSPEPIKKPPSGKARSSQNRQRSGPPAQPTVTGPPARGTTQPSPMQARVDSLESRLSGLEAKQDVLAEKVDSQFAEVSSQLARILGAVSKGPRTGPLEEAPALKAARFGA